MPRRVYSFDPPDRFVAGAIGQPGQRIFFLQATKGSQMVSVALEKQQVAVLAERLGTLLIALRQSGLEIGQERSLGTSELSQPIVEEFRVGTLTLAWDAENERVIIEAREMSDDDELDSDAEDLDEQPVGTADELAAEQRTTDALRTAIERLIEPDGDDDAELDVVHVALEPEAALEFATAAIAVVQAGRLACPMCGEPLEPTGHFCTRRNGYTH